MMDYLTEQQIGRICARMTVEDMVRSFNPRAFEPLLVGLLRPGTLLVRSVDEPSPLERLLATVSTQPTGFFGKLKFRLRSWLWRVLS